MRSLEENNTLNQLKSKMKQEDTQKAQKIARKEQQKKEEKKLLHQGFEEIEEQMMHSLVDEKAIDSEILSTAPQQRKAKQIQKTKPTAPNKQNLPQITGDDFSDLFQS